jgi:hypothetical protein
LFTGLLITTADAGDALSVAMQVIAATAAAVLILFIILP